MDGPRWPLARTADGGTYTVTDPETGLVRTFTPRHDGAAALLREIADRNGNRITFAYDTFRRARRHPQRWLPPASDVGRRRITGLSVGEVRAMGYGYTDGHLTEVTSSSGLPLRFGYDEQGGSPPGPTPTTAATTTSTTTGTGSPPSAAKTATSPSLRLRRGGPGLPGPEVTTLTSPEGAVTRT